MAAGDLDGDGDTDIVLGSFLPGPPTISIPEALQKRWVSNRTSVLIVENVLRKPVGVPYKSGQ